MTRSILDEGDTAAEQTEMRREINWADAFWIVSGASTLVLSIGSIAAQEDLGIQPPLP